MVNKETMLEVIEEFDFEKVRIAMDAVGWIYSGQSGITVGILKTTAMDLWEFINDWNNDEYTSIMSGGFKWSKRYNGAPLELEFILTGVDWIGGDDV